MTDVTTGISLALAYLTAWMDADGEGTVTASMLRASAECRGADGLVASAAAAVPRTEGPRVLLAGLRAAASAAGDGELLTAAQALGDLAGESFGALCQRLRDAGVDDNLGAAVESVAAHATVAAGDPLEPCALNLAWAVHRHVGGDEETMRALVRGARAAAGLPVDRKPTSGVRRAPTPLDELSGREVLEALLAQGRADHGRDTIDGEEAELTVELSGWDLRASTAVAEALRTMGQHATCAAIGDAAAELRAEVGTAAERVACDGIARAASTWRNVDAGTWGIELRIRSALLGAHEALRTEGVASFVRVLEQRLAGEAKAA
jgi:hypothetical protein